MKKKFEVELTEDMLAKMRKGYETKRTLGGWEVKNLSDDELAAYFISMGLNYVDERISGMLEKKK